MKKSRFSETQIVSILKEADAGLPVIEVCRKNGISSPTYYQVEGEVRRSGGVRAEADQGAGSGKREAQADVRGQGHGGGCAEGCDRKKTLGPTEKRAMISYLTEARCIPSAPMEQM